MSGQRLALAGALLALAGLAGSLAVGHLGLGLPRADLPGLAWLMVRAALLAAGLWGGAAALLLRPPVLRRMGGLRWQIAGASLVGSLLLLALLLSVTQAMFISADHDLPLLLTLLLFTAVLAAIFSVGLGHLLTRRIDALRLGAARMAGGDLTTRLPVAGRDELSALASDLNEMADALAAAAVRQGAMEAARRDLTVAISHDLRTPIAAARAMLEALEDGVVSDAATVERYLRGIGGELERMGGLVNDLFELAQIDAGLLAMELEPASLRDLLSDAISSAQPQAASRQIELVGESIADTTVLISPRRTQRVLANLLDNALRHTPPQGTVRVRAAAEPALVRVDVEDSGEGIAESDLPLIFEWSYRGEKSRAREPGSSSAGAGLGLAIARGIVEAQGGRIWAERMADQGARLSFTLRRG